MAQHSNDKYRVARHSKVECLANFTRGSIFECEMSCGSTFECLVALHSNVKCRVAQHLKCQISNVVWLTIQISNVKCRVAQRLNVECRFQIEVVAQWAHGVYTTSRCHDVASTLMSNVVWLNIIMSNVKYCVARHSNVE